MKSKMLITLAVILVLIAAAASPARAGVAEKAWVVYDTETGRRIGLNDLSEKLFDYDVAFVGEKHGNQAFHRFELCLLRSLYSKSRLLAVGMEMFERDVQNVLDKYFKGRITEKEFVNKSRPWKNYRRDYRPIVEFCKRNGIAVTASNIPRRIAAAVAGKGIHVLDTMDEKERKYMPSVISVLDDDYKKRFFKKMKSIRHGKMKLSEKRLERLYAAQSLKDDAMAESIRDYLRKKKKTKLFVHYNGSFHSDYRLGIAKKLKKLNPRLRVVVISCVPSGNLDKVKPVEYKKIGRYVVFVKK